jgi:hypothetical protein
MCLSVGTTSKCHFSLGLPSGSPKTRTIVVSKLWLLISFSNQVCFENARAISYSPQKDLFKVIYHAPIKPHLTPAFQGFVVETQISNLISTPSFDHNSCKIKSKWTMQGHFNHLCFKNFLMVSWGPNLTFFFLFNQGFKHSQLPHECNSQNGSALKNHWASSFALSPICECVSHLNTLSASWAFAFHT